MAEDNEINTELAVILLECKGFVVEIAENGLRALEMFNNLEVTNTEKNGMVYYR